MATIQTLGGSGGRGFPEALFPDAGVWVSDPQENHIAVFAGAGFEVSTYPGMTTRLTASVLTISAGTLNTLPARSIVLLHPCCAQPDRGRI